MNNKIEEINNKIEKLYSKIEELENIKSNLIISNYNTIIDKYWKIEQSCEPVTYLKCNNCFLSGPDIIVEGEAFYFNEGKYNDNTYFHYTKCCQITVEKTSWKKFIEVEANEITKDQFYEKLHSTLESFDSYYWN